MFARLVLQNCCGTLARSGLVPRALVGVPHGRVVMRLATRANGGRGGAAWALLGPARSLGARGLVMSSFINGHRAAATWLAFGTRMAVGRTGVPRTVTAGGRVGVGGRVMLHRQMGRSSGPPPKRPPPPPSRPPPSSLWTRQEPPLLVRYHHTRLRSSTATAINLCGSPCSLGGGSLRFPHVVCASLVP
jgi:hypothetical protein